MTKFVSALLLALALAPAAALMKTVTSVAGMTCTQSGNASATCTFSPEFGGNFAKAMGTGLKFKPPAGTTAVGHVGAKSGSVAVCEDMADFIPTGCTCVDTTEGGTAKCSVDMNGLDTIELEVDMNVCATPLEVGFKLTDGDTGLVFEYTVTAGEQGEVPTGIMIGVPDVGEAEIFLIYELDGNLDALTMLFGFDLGLDVLGYEYYCSYYYPTDCPIYFLNETMDFGDSCN